MKIVPAGVSSMHTINNHKPNWPHKGRRVQTGPQTLYDGVVVK